MFNDNIQPIISNVLVTRGGKYIFQKGIVTISWSWTDDEVKLHTNRLNDILYVPDSPVNIISATVLSESVKDYQGTWLLPKGKYSIFTWYFGKYKNRISQSENHLIELEIQYIFSKFAGFFNRVGSI